MEIGSDFIETGFDGQKTHLLYRTRNPISVIRQAIALVRVVRRFAPNIIHVEEDSKDVLAAALPFLPRKPLVYSMHDPAPHEGGTDERLRKRTRHGLYIAQLRHRADAVILHSSRLMADAKRSMGKRSVPMDVVPHGPLGQRSAALQRNPIEAGRCLFFGRIEAYKGLDTFIAVVQHLHQSGVPVRGVVAGRGPALEPWRSQLESSPQFELLDRFIEPEEAVKEFQRANVVLMPYREATQSGVAAFALGVGRPVVAFDVGGLSDCISDGETGILVPAGDFDAFAAATAKLIADASLARRMGEAALARSRGEGSWATIAHSHLAIYKKALG